MTGYPFAVALVLGVVVVVFQLLRTQRIREKYAAIWLALATAVVLLGVFPRLAEVTASAVGVRTPINLVFALATLVLFIVVVQLSAEISRAEETARTLIERLALLQLEVDDLKRRIDQDDDQPVSTEPDRP